MALKVLVGQLVDKFLIKHANIVLVNDSRTNWLTHNIMPFLIFSDKLSEKLKYGIKSLVGQSVGKFLIKHAKYCFDQ